MSDSLASLRRAKGISQEQLGKQLANRLSQKIGATYAQKKIARFETGLAQPTAEELGALATELGVETEFLGTLVSARAPLDAVSVMDQLAPSSETGRSLVASCLLSRPRPQAIYESLRAAGRLVTERNTTFALFVPYPSAVNLPETADHITINHLFAYYANVRKAVLDSNLAFTNSLDPELAKKAVGLYFPRPEILKSMSFLIPPVFRQFTLTVKQEHVDAAVTKSLHIWTPDTNEDTSKPVRATGTYSIDEQIDAWTSFFGDVIPHWIAHRSLPDRDAYWERVNLRTS